MANQTRELLRTFCLNDDVVGYEVDGPAERIGQVKSVTPDGGWAVVATGRILPAPLRHPGVDRAMDRPAAASAPRRSHTHPGRGSPEHDGRGVLNAHSTRILRSYYGRLNVCLFLPL